MEGFRARDADRERHVDLIEAAYVDGQLNDADRELRVGRALAAETLDELTGLTRDLQRPASAGAATPLPPPARRSSRSRRTALVLVLGVVVVLIGLLVTLVALAPSAPVVESSGVTLEPTRVPPAVSPTEEVVEEVAPFAMTAPEVRRFLREYEARFGTTDAYVTTFFPDRVSVEVPVRGSRPRFERWTWDGEWQRTSEPAAVPGFNAILDQGRINAKRLVANVGVAERTLGVQRAAFTHATARVWPGDGPTVFVYVGNDFEETAFISTDLSGATVRDRFPYAG